MTGDGLDRLGRRLLREAAYSTIVAPAIADLQYESPLGRQARARAYLGALRALACAVLMEIGEDCVSAIRAARIVAMAGPALLTLALAGAWSTPMLWWMYFQSPRPWHHSLVLFALSAPGLFAMIAPSLALPAAAALARTGTPGSRRAALLLTIAVAAAIVAASHGAGWRVTPLLLDMLYSSNTSVRAGDQERPLWELRRRFADQLEALKARDPRVRDRLERQRPVRRFNPLERHKLASRTAQVIPFALFGVVWSSRGRWTAGLLGGGVFCAFVALQIALHRLFYIHEVLGFVGALWAPVLLLLLTALLVAARAKGRLKPTPTPGAPP